MKLRGIVIKSFRSYSNLTRINFDNFTAIIGKNDIGKSTILEALEIFFNNSLIKIDHSDLSILCKESGDLKITIGCIFDHYPEKIVIDASASTTLQDEYLLNKDGLLEIHKVYDCSKNKISNEIYAVAHHPINPKLNDLLILKNQELKSRLEHFSIDHTGIDLRSNVEIRRALWSNNKNELEETLIPLNQEDAKKIYDKLEDHFPMFALFQSDRPSKDDDSEVQDPMKFAIKYAIDNGLKDKLDEIKKEIEKKVTEVANRTIEKLKEMDASLAKELRPNFKSEPKWESLFKLTLTDDNQVPLNKRGSGVRRLILLNFFRAEAERIQKEQNSQGIIYAIEEPETSQHPNYQEMLIDVLLNISEIENHQIIITTHVPALAGRIPTKSIRYIVKENNQNTIKENSEEILEEIATSLGVLPDNKVKVILCVEGSNDIAFLKHISSILNTGDDKYVNLTSDRRIAFIPMGGSTLKQWVENRYLKEFHRPELHIYDLDDPQNPKYKNECEEVNKRTDGSWATLTSKKEIENYIHPDAIKEEFGFEVTFNDFDDVGYIIAKKQHELNSDKTWEEIDLEKQEEKIRKVKNRLNHRAVLKMSIDRIKEIDTNKDMDLWFSKISSLLKE